MAYTFDGADDYISWANHANYNPGTGDFTIVFWYKSSTVPTEDDRIFAKGAAKRYEIAFDHDSLIFSIDDDVDKTDPSVGYPAELTDGVWHCYMFERDAGNRLKGFIDNVEKIDGADGTGNSIDDVTKSLVIGGGEYGIAPPCSMAEGAFFKRLLTAGEKASMVAGYSPQFFFPNAYFPIIRDRIDRITGTVGGLTSAPSVSAHPPVIYPAPSFISFPSAVAGPVAKAVAGSLAMSGALARKATFKRAVAGAL